MIPRRGAKPPEFRAKKDLSSQGNRVKESSRDEAREEVIIPSGDLSL